MRRHALIRAARRHSVAPRAEWLPIVLVLALLGAGCDLNVTGGPPPSPPPSVALQRTDTAPTPLPTARPTSSTAAQDCPVTEPVEANPPTVVPDGRPFIGPGQFYVSPDRKIWARVGGWNTSAPGDMGVLWLKPLGVTLEIRGRRLDGAAPPLEVFAGGDNLRDFQVVVGGLTFPTEGCWEIVARSGESMLRFVMYANAVYVHGIRRADTAPTPLPTAQPSSSTAAQDCPVTEPTIATPPTAVIGERGFLPRGPYYVSADRQVWAQDWGWTSTPGTRKVLWLKPLGAPLELRGQRLDAEAPPLRISSSGDDQFDYQASHLIFPTEGCWVIVAQSGSSVLRFVMYIHAVHVSS